MMQRLMSMQNITEEEAVKVANTFINFGALGMFAYSTLIMAVISGCCLCSVSKAEESKEMRDACHQSAQGNFFQPLPLDESYRQSEIPRGIVVNY